MCFFDKDCSVKILRCLLPGFGKTTSWPMLLHALRAKSVIHVSVGFDSSPPKPLSSSLLKYLGCVSIFRRLFVPSDCIRLHTCIFWLHGVFWVYVFAHLNPKDSPRLDRVSVSPHYFPQHCGVDLRWVYSVVITVLRVLFAGVLSQFCLSWRPRGLDPSSDFS